MIQECTVIQAHEAVSKGQGHILDVRSQAEWQKGYAQNAHWVGRDHLEANVLSMQLDLDAPVYLICASGRRSLFAGTSLEQLGFSQVFSVRGGTSDWIQQGLPLHTPNHSFDRYERQCKLPEVTTEGQQKLLESHVLILGLGGLGCPVAMYLAGAGVGHLTIVDIDVVEKHNLHRQVLYSQYQIGMQKSDAAFEKLVALNPDIHITRISASVDEALLNTLVPKADLVVECTDALACRYLVDTACKTFHKPWVYGACDQWSGQVALFSKGKGAEHCYTCLYPEHSSEVKVKSCQESGVMGIVPGTIGLMQATLSLNWLLDLPMSWNTLTLYNAKTLSLEKIKLCKQPNCKSCC